MSRKLIFNIVFYAVGGWFTWASIGVAAVTTAGKLVSSNQAKQSAPATVSYAPVDVSQTTGQAVNAGLSNLGGIESLLSQSNSFTQDQATAMMEKAVPGYANFAKQLTAAGTTALEHPYDLPQDVQTKLEQMAAEKGISVGGGGQFQGFSAMSLLGTNMLNYGQQNFQNAISALTTVTGTAPRVSPASPMSMFISPSQATSVAQTNAGQTQATQQAGANAGAAATNWNSLMQANSLQTILGTLSSPSTGNTSSVGGGQSTLATILGQLFGSGTPAANAQGGYGNAAYGPGG